MVHYTPEMLSGTWWEESRHGENPLYADGVSYQAYYSEEGKALYMGKDLTEVRSLQRKLVPDNVGLGKYEPTSLQGIAIKAGICMMQPPYAKASTTEEPDAGKPHVRVCTGGAW